MAEQLVFGHWTMDQLEEARKIAVEVMKIYGDLTGDEYQRFLKNPWNDHCSVQAALRAMPKATLDRRTPSPSAPDTAIEEIKEITKLFTNELSNTIEVHVGRKAYDHDAVCKKCRWRGGHNPCAPCWKEPWPMITLSQDRIMVALTSHASTYECIVTLREARELHSALSQSLGCVYVQEGNPEIEERVAALTKLLRKAKDCIDLLAEIAVHDSVHEAAVSLSGKIDAALGLTAARSSAPAAVGEAER